MRTANLAYPMQNNYLTCVDGDPDYGIAWTTNMVPSFAKKRANHRKTLADMSLVETDAN